MPRNGSEPESIVRYGEPVDEKQIRTLLLLGHAENSIFSLDINKAVFVIRRLLYTPWLPPDDPGLRGAFGVIGPRGGVLEGLVMLAIGQQWYTSAQYLEEYIVYVHPDHRTSGHAAALIDWMIGRSEQLGLPLLTGIISQTRTAAKIRLYRRKLRPVGEFFIHMPQQMRWESSVILGSSSAA